MTKKILFSTSIGIILSCTGLYLALRNIPFSELFIYFRTIEYIWILPATAAVIMSFGLRVLRWQLILSSSRKIRFSEALHPLLIGFMINCILPGRVGEIARPAILKKKSHVPFFTGIATVAAERLFDLMILLGLFAWTMGTVDFHAASDISFSGYHLSKETLDTLSRRMAELSVLLLAGIVAVSIQSIRTLLSKVIMAFPGMIFFLNEGGKKWIAERISLPAVKLLENFSSGFSLVKYPVKMLSCMVLSALVWVSQAYSYYLVARGCPGISLSFIDIFIVMIIICFFIALPSAPGFWGLWEAGGVFALGLFGISQKEAAGFTLANHVVQMLPVIVLGWISAMAISIDIRQVASGDHMAEGDHIAEKD